MRRLGLLLFVTFAALAGWSVLHADAASAEEAPSWPPPSLTLPTDPPRPLLATEPAWPPAALGLPTEAPNPLVETPPAVDPPPPPPPPPAPAAAADPALAGSGEGRRVVYSNSRQRVWWVEADGTIARTYLVSGRRGTPRPGTYAVFSKSRRAYSGRVHMDNMVRFAHGRSLAIGFHAIPVGRRGPIQGLNELGQYRSHGCVRQAPADAAALWDWAPIGTKVVVTA